MNQHLQLLEEEEADESWKRRFQELVLYHKEHGHSLVQQHYRLNKKLGSWVAAQRKYYRLMEKGKTSQMTHWKIQQLESIDFLWFIGKGSNRAKLLAKVELASSHSHLHETSTVLNDNDIELARLIANFPQSSMVRTNNAFSSFSNLLLAATQEMDTSSTSTSTTTTTSTSTTTTTTAAAAAATTTTCSTHHRYCHEEMDQYLTTITNLQQQIAKLQHETTQTQTQMEQVVKALGMRKNDSLVPVLQMNA
jgi:methyl-accepting chemotaxis protein